MNKEQLTRHALPVAVAVISLALTACVDNDYDLSKDVDLTMTLGGDAFTVPTSDSEESTLDQILDIDEESDVRFANAGDFGMEEGDMYLYSDDDDSEDKIHMTTESVTVSGTPVDFDAQSISFGSGTTASLSDYQGHFTMHNDDVSPTLQRIDTALVASDIAITFTSQSGSLRLEQGFTIRFPRYVTVEKTGTGDYTASGNTVTVTATTDVSSSKTLRVKATQMDIIDGLSDNDITFSPGTRETEETAEVRGDIEMAGLVTCGGPVSKADADGSSRTLITDIEIGDMAFTSIYGLSDPVIGENIEPMTFDDVPSVLQDEETFLDWANPQVYLSITNPTPMHVDFTQISLESKRGDDVDNAVIVGKDKDGTEGDFSADPGPDVTTLICLSKAGAPTSEPDRDVLVRDINDLIGQIPDEIDVNDIEVMAEGWVDLDREYALDVSYKLVAPMRFGENLNVVYRDTLSGWRDDIRKIEKINQLNAELVFLNKLPLDMKLASAEVEAIDQEGNVIGEFECSLEDADGNSQDVISISAGVSNSTSGRDMRQTTTNLTIHITPKGDGTEVQRLDGLRLTMRGDNVTKEAVGIPMNNTQSIKLDQIKLSMPGGATFNFN